MPWKFVSMDPQAGKSPERETFVDAFRDMYRYVKAAIDAGNMSYQVLETAIWIDTPTGVPIYFYDARDVACRTGLMDLIQNGN